MIRYLVSGVVGAILAVGVSVAAQDLPRAECVCDVPEGYVLASPSSPASLPVLVPVITPVVSFDEDVYVATTTTSEDLALDVAVAMLLRGVL